MRRRACQLAAHSPIEEIVDAWAIQRALSTRKNALKHEAAAIQRLPAWVEFVLLFDVEYRRRRLNFLIEGQNRLYRLLDHNGFPGLQPSVVDGLKRDFYLQLDVLQQCEESRFFTAEALALAADLFKSMPSTAEIRNPSSYACEFVAGGTIEKLDVLVDTLSAEIDLNASTRDLDELLASMLPVEWHADARREVLVNYLGFPFWDVLTFPVTTGRGTSELREILVDRISPEEAHTLKDFAGVKSLKGRRLREFRRLFLAPLS